MQTYLVKRGLLFIPTLFIVVTLVFLILRIVPGDPAIMLLSGSSMGDDTFSQEALDKTREKLGTDRPLIVQYGTWVGGMFKLDFGNSYRYENPVWEDIRRAFPVTLELTILSLFMATVIAVPMGVYSALKQDTFADYVGRIISIGGIAVPNFWVAVLMVFILASYFDWLPPLAYETFQDDPLVNMQQMVFPVLALGFSQIALMARLTRSAVLEVLREDYIRTARAKGLAEMVVIARHALRNALLPVVTVAGYQFSTVLGGTVLIENVFDVPGMGRLLWEAINWRDFPLIQAIVVVITVIVLVINLTVDVLYAWLNPRIRYA